MDKVFPDLPPDSFPPNLSSSSIFTINEKYIESIQCYEFNINNIKVGDAIRITNNSTQDSMNLIICDMLYDLSYDNDNYRKSFKIYNKFKAIDNKDKIHIFNANEFAGKNPLYKLEVLK